MFYLLQGDYRGLGLGGRICEVQVGVCLLGTRKGILDPSRNAVQTTPTWTPKVRKIIAQNP